MQGLYLKIFFERLFLIYHFQFIAFAYYRIRCLGRKCYPVYALGKFVCSVCLYLNETSFPVKHIHKSVIRLKRRLASGKNNVFGIVLSYRFGNILKSHFYAPFKVGIAKRTIKVAIGQTDKNSGYSGEIALSLKSIKYIVYSVCIVYVHFFTI